MCSVLYYVTIKRDEKVLAARRVSQGMALIDRLFFEQAVNDYCQLIYGVGIG